MSTPTKRTPRKRVSAATRARTGASFRHGPHHEPQKLSTTVWPRQPAMSRCPPVSVVPEISGARGRCAAGMTWPTAGSPPNPEPVRWTTPAARSPAAATAIAPDRTSRARRVIRRLLFLRVGETPADQVFGVGQDLVSNPVASAEGQLGPGARVGEAQQQDLLPPAARHQAGHRNNAAGVGLAGEESRAADSDRVRGARAPGGVTGHLLIHGHRADLP